MTRTEKQRALDAIAAQIQSCRICQEHALGKAVPGEGNPDADIVFIGEAPGKTEAQTGRPFVGRSGKLLRSEIQAIGLSDKDVYITSPVKYLPVYKTPKPHDIAHGREHLEKQLAIIQPKLIVLMGATAAKAVLSQSVSITKDHGQVFEEGGKKYVVIFHPAAAIRFQPIKKLFLMDFQKIKDLVAAM